MKHHSTKRPCVQCKAWINDQPALLTIKGKPARVLKALVEQKEEGVTALELSNTWALRMSGYISDLRHKYSLHITTNKEDHSGGWHGRYVLITPVEILKIENMGA